jgi:hypothetical protein
MLRFACERVYARPATDSCVVGYWDVWKVRGLTSLLRVGTLSRCGDGLVFEVPPLANDALLTTFHPRLENVLQNVDHLEISCLGAPFSWLEKTRNRTGRDLDCMEDVLMGFHRSTFPKPNTEFNSDLAPCDFYDLPTTISELRGKKFRSVQRSGWSVVRSASLDGGGGGYFERETVTAPPQSFDSE